MFNIIGLGAAPLNCNYLFGLNPLLMMRNHTGTHHPTHPHTHSSNNAKTMSTLKFEEGVALAKWVPDFEQ